MIIFAYISKHWKSLLLGLIPCYMILAFINIPPIVYRGMLILYFFLFAAYSKKIDIKYLFFIIAISIGALISLPPEIFNVWLRLPLLILVIGVTTQLFSSETSFLIQRRALKYVTYVMALVSVGSFFCYLLGINFVVNYYSKNHENYGVEGAGTFGGLTSHSMLLAFVAALSIVYFVWLLYERKWTKYKKWSIIFCSVASVLSLFRSASRVALVATIIGVLVIVFLNYKGKVSKFLVRIVAAVALLATLYPLYSGFTTAIEQKQLANIQKGSTFTSRTSKWENRLKEFSINPIFGIGVGTVSESSVGDYSKSGIIEPGSSWLAILSMTGLFGMFMFLYILVPPVKKLYIKGKLYGGDYILFCGLLAALFTHMMAEGYIFSGGSFHCFVFWLIFGVGSALAERDKSDFFAKFD